MTIARPSPLQPASIAAALLAALLALPAQANLNNPVSLRLVAPGGVTDGTTVTSTPIDISTSGDPATGFVVGDPASLITSSWMLPGESIKFAGNSIVLTVAGGAQVGNTWMTGYLGAPLDPARYEIGDLSITGQTITGIQLHSSGAVTGGIGAGFQSGAHPMVSFRLDQLTFSAPAAGSSYPYGQFTIDLQTAPVPEPEQAVLLLAGLLALGAWRRAGRNAGR